MDTWNAFMMGEANRDKPVMVFDWNKAAQLIKERKAVCARAGLDGDWEWTGGTIWDDGKPDLDSYTFLASTRATPILDLDGEEIPCWVYEKDSPDWTYETKWPESALAIINEP